MCVDIKYDLTAILCRMFLCESKVFLIPVVIPVNKNSSFVCVKTVILFCHKQNWNSRFVGLERYLGYLIGASVSELCFVK